MRNRVGRAIVGVVFLVLFGIYTYKQLGIRTFSNSGIWGEATGLHPEGFESGVDISDMSIEPTPELPPSAEAKPEPTPEITLEPTPTPLRFDLTSWELVLVNGEHTIDEYVPENLVYLDMTAENSDQQTAYNPNRIAVDARIADALLAFAQGCREAGLPVYLSSGYRSYSEQRENYQRVVNNGYPGGKDANGHYVSWPAGCSEHQTGLCCDITDVYRNPKDPDFLETTETYQWLLAHCTEYGFILRYPNGKGDITGVMYEPWHFRYVGVEAAQYIMENELTLEEFWETFGNEA